MRDLDDGERLAVGRLLEGDLGALDGDRVARDVEDARLALVAPQDMELHHGALVAADAGDGVVDGHARRVDLVDADDAVARHESGLLRGRVRERRDDDEIPLLDADLGADALELAGELLREFLAGDGLEEDGVRILERGDHAHERAVEHLLLVDGLGGVPVLDEVPDIPEHPEIDGAAREVQAVVHEFDGAGSGTGAAGRILVRADAIAPQERGDDEDQRQVGADGLAGAAVFRHGRTGSFGFKRVLHGIRILLRG